MEQNHGYNWNKTVALGNELYYTGNTILGPRNKITSMGGNNILNSLEQTYTTTFWTKNNNVCVTKTSKWMNYIMD
jgi:hypothetical protein